MIMRQGSNLCVMLLLSVVGAPPASHADGTPKLLDHKKLWLLKKKPAAGSSAPQTPTSNVTFKLSDLLLRPPSRYPLTTVYLPVTPSYLYSPVLPSISSHSSYISSPPGPSPAPYPSSTAGGGCVVEGKGALQGRLLKEGTSEALGGGVCGVRHCAKYGDKFVLEEEKCNLVIHNPNYTCLQFEDHDEPFPLCCPRLECND